LSPTRPALFLTMLFASGMLSLYARQSGSVQLTVTYVSSKQVYFDAGTEQGVAVGDTVSLSRPGQSTAEVVITAVASHSSVGRPIGSGVGIKTGDRGSIAKRLSENAAPTVIPAPAVRESGVSFPPSQTGPSAEPENVLTGRIGLQYTGEWADDSRLNIAQPAALAHLRLRNVMGTGMVLSFSGREYYDFSDSYARYGDSVRSRFDLYQLQLERDRPGDWFGFSAGRMVSRYVSGLGIFDGGQAFLRQGAFTSGVLVGKGIQGRALGVGGDDTKTAVFVGFQKQDEPYWNYEASAAYALQKVNGKLDRSFIYLQGSAALGPMLSMFGNAEVDLNESQNGQRTSTRRLSSAMVYVSYYPVRWLSASLGYDGTRSVYLFETMKGIPDSLFNESLRHGFRARVSARVFPGIDLTGAASYGTRKGDARDTRTLSGSARFADLFQSGIQFTARYADITNVYLAGTDVTFELERFFISKVNLLLRYDSYSYSITGIGHAYQTRTVSTSLNWYLSRSLYSTIRGDYIIDETMNSVRAFVEVGLWF
jgi:hypothetical protein